MEALRRRIEAQVIGLSGLALGQIDYENPLQLLARSVEFTDPLSGELRRFESQRRLTLPPFSG